MVENSYERYAKIRDLRGFTDYKVTKLAGIKGTATISNWKNGKYTPKDDKMQEIANALDVSLDYLKGNVNYTTCPICGFDDDPLDTDLHEKHKIFHNKFLKIKEKYPFFQMYGESDKVRTESIFEFRKYGNTLEQKMAAFEKYLQASFSLEIIQNSYNYEKLNYEQFCKAEVATMHEDDCISKEFINALADKYGVDRSFIFGTERLLARISGNEKLMRLLAYAEKLTPQFLDALEAQAKAWAESNNKKDEE